MKSKGHGRRYSDQEKRDILNYLESHTYKETSKQFNISEPTIARWKQSVSAQRSKIIFSIPQFWLDYLNEKITQDVWENYDEALVQLLKNYDNTQKLLKSGQFERDFLHQFADKFDRFIEKNAEIDAVIAKNPKQIEYQSTNWPSPNISPLIKGWKRMVRQYKMETSVKFNGIKYIISHFNQEQILFSKGKFTFIGDPEDAILKDYQPFHEHYICGIRTEIHGKWWYFFTMVNRNGLNKSTCSIHTTLMNFQRLILNTKPVTDEEISEPFAKRELFQPYSINLDKISIGKVKAQNAMNETVYLKEQVPLRDIEQFVLKQFAHNIGQEIPLIKIIPQDADLATIQENQNRLFFTKVMYYAFNGHITHLRVRGVDLKEIPSIIKELTHLQTLDLRDNTIQNLPDSMADLISLESLYLTNNRLNSLSDIFNNLHELHMLDLENNQFAEFPPALYHTTHLWEINLARNNISTLPTEVTNLERLRHLDLTENPIEKLDESFKNNLHTYMVVKL